MEIRTLILAGLLFDFLGSILLASEMIDLIEKIRNWNSSLQEEIHAIEIGILELGLTSAILYFFVDFLKEFKFKEMFKILFIVLSLYLLIFISIMICRILNFFEYFTDKLGTKKILGTLGIILIFFGFIIQFYINLLLIN